MNGYRMKSLVLALGATTVIVASVTTGFVDASPPAISFWQVVVNNSDAIPGHPDRVYNSYNPPSVNAGGVVVFRARSTGRQGGPVSGIYTRDMAFPGAELNRIADRDTSVPEPNNTFYPSSSGGGTGGGPPEWRLSTFNEFPSFPRIAMTADAVATRGNHRPIWTYSPESAMAVPDEEEDEDSTRLGNTGVYVNLQASATHVPGELVTGGSQLGLVPEFADLFAVPGVDPLARFDVFPGSPAITDEGLIAFKGNYSVDDPASDNPLDVLGRTGVFYRQVEEQPYGGEAAIQLVANSTTPVPNPGACPPGTSFGSTAPPSAVGEHMVFVGFDNEEAPTCGGVYLAPMTQPPGRITALVGLETRVPGQGGETFTAFGEGLSYDGRLVGFWGAWGDETRIVRLYCPTEGNQARRSFCNQDYADPNTGEVGGDPHSVCDDTADPRWPVCYQEKRVSLHQGIFVYDTRARSPALRLRLVARTGAGEAFDDFVYWNYSGAPPGAGESEGDAEPPRWRSSAFLSVSSGRGGNPLRAVFLARTGSTDVSHRYIDPVDGIYLARGPGQGAVLTLVETGMDGTLLDPQAVWDDDEDATTAPVPLPITSLALEREAFRGDWLAITAGMGVEEAGWAGIYLTEVLR